MCDGERGGAPAAPFSLGQRLALNLRLSRLEILSAGKGKDRREAKFGSGFHLTELDGTPHDRARCETQGGRRRIDWHGSTGDADLDERTHPEDFLPEGVCPARYHEPALLSEVWAVLELKEMGGLGASSGMALDALPDRPLTFYTAALAAWDRFQNQREAALLKIHQR